MVAQIVDFKILDRGDVIRLDQRGFLVNVSQSLQGVDDGSCGRAEQAGSLAGDDLSVRQLYGHGRSPGCLGLLPGNNCDFPVGGGHTEFIHEQLDLGDGRRVNLFAPDINESAVIPADDLLPGCLNGCLLVHDAVADHVDTHICRRFVRGYVLDPLDDPVEDREDFHIAVIVDRCGAIGFQMERVNHIDVIQVSGGRFVGQIDRVMQVEVPDREGFKLGIARFDAPFLIVVQLGDAGGHFARTRPRGCNDNQVTAGFNIIISAKSVR